MTYEHVIIGGGIAGLCCAIELCRQGFSPLIIEAGNYPTHKVCGEFLSPECLAWLEKLHINPSPIKQAMIYSGGKTLHFTLPSSAGGLSHYQIDPALLQNALSMGAKILTETTVNELQPKKAPREKHLLKLSSGETLSASHIFIGSGRLSCLQKSTPPSMKYIGIKAHFDIELDQTLHMYGFRGAYLGLSPIEQGKSNLACLVTIDRFKKAGSAECLINELISESPPLQEMLSSSKKLFPEWMQASIPFFGFKITPDWLDAFFIGDAALSVPPACGGGLSLAISSGIMAAQYAVSNQSSFQKNFKWLSFPTMQAAKGLHYALMTPYVGRVVVNSCNLFPLLTQQLFRISRPPSIQA